jgi:hypothetical protein
MTELTKEYFDQGLRTLETNLTKKIYDQTEQLARMIADTVATPMEQHFADLKDYLEVREDVQALKVDMQKIKEALHIR